MPETPDKITLTPMMKQYLEVKKDTPADSILMFRMGDFYEMFFDDAKKASPVLEIALTSRAGAPLCGIPYRTIDAYLPKLLNAGFKVAVAEQLEDPSLAQGIVTRGITRVITPGTILEDSLLTPENNNFLCSYVRNKNNIHALAKIDISTGEFTAAEFATHQEFIEELYKIRPRECLIPAAFAEEKTDAPQNILWTPLDDWIFSYDHANSFLINHFGVANLEGFGFTDETAAIQAAGAILYYMTENLRCNAGHVKRLLLKRTDEFMRIDPNSRRNLELVESLYGNDRHATLFSIMNRCRTPMGSRMMRSWVLNPLRDVTRIAERQDAVELFRDDPLTLAELRETMGMIRDLERITSKLNSGINPRDMLTLAKSLTAIPGIKSIIAQCSAPIIEKICSRLHPLNELADEILSTIVDEPPAFTNDGGIIRKGKNSELDELRSAATDGRNWVATLQAKEQQRTGIRTLKVNYNKVFGYFIEVTKANAEHVPADYIKKQTLVNNERYITPELKEMESKILGSDDKAKALEAKLFDELRQKAAKYIAEIQQNAEALAELDCLGSLAECAAQYAYCRPHITDGDVIDIKGGRHPVLDATMREERFIPNDTLLDSGENNMMIITGPNMAGKSTYIRQTALLVIMAQTGSFIPASSAEIGIADKIFTRVGASDDISRGQSTFMVEMLETANILNNATPKSLIILDEIGRGTSTFDGLSIAWAVAEYILECKTCKARSQFATHYHELTELALTHKGVKNYNVAVREYGEKIIFLRQIIPGAADKSYGIHVAKLAGLPDSVIKRAKEILENLENNAIADAGLPALIREKPRKYMPNPRKAKISPEVQQPGLFD